MGAFAVERPACGAAADEAGRPLSFLGISAGNPARESSRSGGSAGWCAAPFPSATNVLSSSSSDSSGSLTLAGVALADGFTPTGPRSVIGIGTFAALGISGIASGGTLPDTNAGGCVMTFRREPSSDPPAAGTMIGTLGPFARAD